MENMNMKLNLGMTMWTATADGYCPEPVKIMKLSGAPFWEDSPKKIKVSAYSKNSPEYDVSFEVDLGSEVPLSEQLKKYNCFLSEKEAAEVSLKLYQENVAIRVSRLMAVINK